jgi:putative resolvase
MRLCLTEINEMDLSNQVEFLKQFANARGVIVDECMEDIGS